ncbi:hypothetical protein SEA_LEOPARD_39 [Mycobacterium phage Leopard]|uniref:Uncharacterized protein n=1 Tax=Mycobacterium phage Onyinye TaxID=2686235 RepID=A0A6B9L743_9CAUD|nr:hypothetical protein PP339_gp040 [Mycobacterium phage Onyinye]QHB37446.1 hypothetical protein SEA_ONYINYE_40 [Mycobacterium phage Onyinye]UOW92917.1 hypothetical protein SEA_LEOPARD_39 [Mycobacterium phage Leopard]WKW85201.1 hypothetical protein SEA_AIKOY__39 [Mycobacterium phage Aikoy]
MAVTPKAYGLFLQSLLEGRIDALNYPIMCALVGSGYTPNQNTHKFRSVVTNEIIGSGYANGGKQVTGIQLQYTAGSRTLKLTGSNVVWPGITFSGARYAVLYSAPPVAISAQPLIAYVDFGANINRVDTPFEIVWPAGGILALAVP